MAAQEKPKTAVKTGVTMEKLVSLCKRRGFVFPSSEIYGGFNGVWDYGPLGVELRNNVKQAWWRDYVWARPDVVGLDAGILASPRVWEASGHLSNFTDPLVECKNCHNRFRADQIDLGKNCPVCGLRDWSDVRQFNTMFKTFVGPVEEDASVAYLRPETCQSIFTNFRLVQQATRKKLPFGIAQVGKAFRNEITTGNFIFRLRELEQMELEYFVRPGEDEAAFESWLQINLAWLESMGVSRERLHLYEHPDEDRAFYSKRTVDIEYDFPFGRSELWGLANRTDYDLTQHMKASGEELDYFDEETKEHVVPYVVEPSLGVDRAMLVFLLEAYEEEQDKEGLRTILRLHPRLAPVKAAVLPLVRRDERLVALAQRIYADVRLEMPVQYDETASVGRRYRRQDEIGTPWCITVDSQSLEDGTVTIRDRDSMAQDRIPADGVTAELQRRLRLPWQRPA
jgi:glycyl-tRNA synthetase